MKEPRSKKPETKLPGGLVMMGLVGMMGRKGLVWPMKSLAAESERAFQGAATLALGASDHHGMAGWPVSAVSMAFWQDER